MTRAHNPAPYEIVVDSEGHILPGHTSAAVDLTDMVAGRLARAGRLVIVPEPEPLPVAPKTRKKSAPAIPAVAEDGE